jgi:hypothetical protein
MDSKTLKEILDQQKAQSEIHKLSESHVSAIIRNKTQAQDPVWKERQKQGVQNAWSDPVKRKQRTEFWNNPEYKEKISKERKERIKNNPKEIEQRREIGKKLHQDPAYRKNYEKALKERIEKGPSQLLIEKARESGLKRRKTLRTPDGDFITIKACAEFYGLAVGSIQTRMSSRPNEYYYIDEFGNRLQPIKHKIKKVQSVDGLFDSLEAAAEFYGIKPNAMDSRIKRHPKKYQYIEQK